MNRQLNLTRDMACDRIETFASEGRLIQSKWHSVEENGRQLACLLGAIDDGIKDTIDCPASVMPPWLANLLPTIFDGVTEARASEYGIRFAKALRIGSADDHVMRKFLIVCVENAVDYAKPKTAEVPPYWPAIASACSNVVTLLSSGGKGPAWAQAHATATEAEAEAEAAAWAAVAAAARSAAWAAVAVAAAARSAAGAAAEAAARTAAWAAEAAVGAAARAAAGAAGASTRAAREKQHELLFDALLSAMMAHGK
jgi:hypothetical protein